MSASTIEIEALAAEIGEQVYIDVAKWHLFLAEAHLHLPLAEQVYPLLESDTLSRKRLTTILQQISVTIGAGKKQLSLLEMIPDKEINQLMEVLETYQEENF